MAEQALTVIDVVFGWGLGTLTEAPTKFEEIEECTSIGGASMTKDKVDVTPLHTRRKKYAGGMEDSGGDLETTFNLTDTFEEQWAKMQTAYDGKSATQAMWFCAYHPSRSKMSAYIVEPGQVPKPEYGPGNALQVTINNVLIDIPDDIAASKPTVGE